jgi:hypothetical protein
LGLFQLHQEDSIEFWWPSISSPSESKSNWSPAPRLTGYSTSWMNSCISTDYPIASSQTWAPTSTITSSGSTGRTSGLASGTSQSPIHGPMDKSSAPTGWYSTLSRSDCTTLLTQKEESGSRNCPMLFGGCVLNPPSQEGSHPISWSTSLKLFYLPTLCGSHWQ